MSFDIAKCMVKDDSKILEALQLTDKVSEIRLKQYTTSQLVAELTSRKGVDRLSLDEPIEYCTFYAYQYDGKELFRRGVIGPAKILVVVD